MTTETTQAVFILRTLPSLLLGLVLQRRPELSLGLNTNERSGRRSSRNRLVPFLDSWRVTDLWMWWLQFSCPTSHHAPGFGEISPSRGFLWRCFCDCAYSWCQSCVAIFQRHYGSGKGPLHSQKEENQQKSVEYLISCRSNWKTRYFKVSD